MEESIRIDFLAWIEWNRIEVIFVASECTIARYFSRSRMSDCRVVHSKSDRIEWKSVDAMPSSITCIIHIDSHLYPRTYIAREISGTCPHTFWLGYGN